MEACNNNRWFALRVIYGREMKLKAHLDARHIDNYIPMRYTDVVKNGKKQRTLLPAIRNLIFAHANRAMLDELKKEMEGQIPMRYIFNKETRTPIVVPDGQMRHFIAVSGTLHEQLMYLTEINPILQQGERVRIKAGPFAGVEGKIVRIKRNRCVMVSVDGVIAVTTAFIPPQLLEKIEEEQQSN